MARVPVPSCGRVLKISWLGREVVLSMHLLAQVVQLPVGDRLYWQVWPEH